MKIRKTQKPILLVEPGYYYHYKHDKDGIVNNYAYEVLNIGHHTEMKGVKSLMVVYRPLYESFVYKAGKHLDLKPLKMFLSPKIIKGKKVKRYTKITNHNVIAQLNDIKKQMYGA